jgi:NAD(P)-dependent dehydrogenase (short-subunit alcohol dehydrogenase family)
LGHVTTTLITGANKGLGYQTALRLLAAGHQVWVGARDPRRGLAAAETLGARFVQLDVTDDASVAAAVERVAAAGGLDVLVNNAGIADRTAVADTRASDVGLVLATNVLGAVRVLQAFAGLLDASSSPVVVNVSSGLGSLAYASDPAGPYASLNLLAYPASKAALNMLTIHWAKAHPRWRVNAADPGSTATDLNDHRGTQTVEEGTDAIVRLATVGPDGPTGTFSDRDGAVPW